MLGAEREVAPQVLVLAQHVAHGIGSFEPRVRPQDAGGGILDIDALDRIDVGMRVQDELVLRASAIIRFGTGRSASAPYRWNSPIAA